MCRMARRRASSGAGGVRLKQDGRDVQDGQDKESHRVLAV